MSRRPRNSAAVMADHAPDEVKADDPLAAIFRKLNFFATGPWGTRAGAEILRSLDPECQLVAEPACGTGTMAGPLAEYFEVRASDVYPHHPTTVIRDWLDDELWGDDEVDWVFTNPPFNLAEDFVRLSRRRARRGVALLLRLGALEGGERHALMAGADPLTLLAVFSERLPMTLGEWDPEAGTATAYAWFFWAWGREPLPPVWIPPGTRDRLWRPDDPARYGKQTPMPLFAALSEDGGGR